MKYDRLLTRVFDSRLNKMCYSGDDYVGLCDDGIWHFDLSLEQFATWHTPMQCVGFRVDSKLLFEWDIVKAFATDGEPAYLVIKRVGAMLKAFRLDAKGWYPDLSVILCGVNFEIIGNAFENSKLYEEIGGNE